MKLDLRSHACKFCGDKSAEVFLCNSCSLYSCKDCFLGYHEDGCMHKKKEVITSQDWTTPFVIGRGGQSLIEEDQRRLALRRVKFLQEIRLMDS